MGDSRCIYTNQKNAPISSKSIQIRLYSTVLDSLWLSVQVCIIGNYGYDFFQYSFQCDWNISQETRALIFFVCLLWSLLFCSQNSGYRNWMCAELVKFRHFPSSVSFIRQRAALLAIVLSPGSGTALGLVIITQCVYFSKEVQKQLLLFCKWQYICRYRTGDITEEPIS